MYKRVESLWSTKIYRNGINLFHGNMAILCILTGEIPKYIQFKLCCFSISASHIQFYLKTTVRHSLMHHLKIISIT